MKKIDDDSNASENKSSGTEESSEHLREAIKGILSSDEMVNAITESIKESLAQNFEEPKSSEVEAVEDTEILTKDSSSDEPLRSGFFRDPNSFVFRCQDPKHDPPQYLAIPPGLIYRHVCPSCHRILYLRDVDHSNTDTPLDNIRRLLFRWY